MKVNRMQSVEITNEQISAYLLIGPQYEANFMYSCWNPVVRLAGHSNAAIHALALTTLLKMRRGLVNKLRDMHTA